MNKKEAAEFLGVSTRQVEKYAKDGRLGEIIYVRGKTGRQAEYDREAVEKLKAVLEMPDTALQPTISPDARLFAAHLIKSLAKSMAKSSAAREQPRSEPVRVSEKILLTVKDCRLLTGLSDASIRGAIKAGKLEAQKLGRGWKIKRKDLDNFIENL